MIYAYIIISTGALREGAGADEIEFWRVSDDVVRLWCDVKILSTLSALST